MENKALPRILLVEDDKKLADLVYTYLKEYGFEIKWAENGTLGLTIARKFQPELIILDLMLPEIDGLSVCRQLRGWYAGRIIMLTASDEDMDQVAALEVGADDFVTKPIHPRVLLARVRMLLRREPLNSSEYGNNNSYSINQISSNINHSNEETIDNKLIHNNVVTHGRLQLKKNHRATLLKNKEIFLTEAEFGLLWFLATHPETTLSRDDITKALRGIAYDGLDRSIDNRIVSLRKKLGDNQGLPKRIITVRGKGYLFVSDQWE